MTAGVVCKFTVHFSTSFSTTSVRLRIAQTKLPDSDEQIRHLLDLIRRAALFSSRSALPTRWPCYEHFQRFRLVLLRRGDVAPPASQDSHSNCRVAELRAGSHSSPWGTRLF